MGTGDQSDIVLIRLGNSDTYHFCNWDQKWVLSWSCVLFSDVNSYRPWLTLSEQRIVLSSQKWLNQKSVLCCQAKHGETWTAHCCVKTLNDVTRTTSYIYIVRDVEWPNQNNVMGCQDLEWRIQNSVLRCQDLEWRIQKQCLALSRL